MSPSAYCGPGTMFIDYAMRYTSSNRVDNDRDGNYGARGTVNQDIVDRFLSTHDYAVHTPPLSIAIEMFGQHEAQSLVDDCLYLGMSDTDTVATITRVTSENIVIQYRRLMKTFFPDQKDIEMFVCGEGAKNMNIIDHLEEALPEVLTKPLDDIGIPDCAKDSVRCAQLGLETILRHALSEGKAEAEEQKNMLGNIVKGNNWGNTQQQIVHFSGGMELPPVRRVIVEDEQ
ncbi:hypothetical protein P280DRAFT_469049 [Massarina eburnea CBS 473.64]|uniref:Actin-like ATPase domain-containing protein n=1 Tax=Massarina eburnea CBS 473.64 TaxID=1395130 RepID=A0A6A6S4T7_9PLEO|nr:hypothetical protein P280DRAFT_469049 [Massarina eburnea CBS 473.64]